MSDMLSQDEINALLSGTGNTDTVTEETGEGYQITDEEKDAIGELSNISMGSAATNLFGLVNQKVEITTPVVTLANWEKFVASNQQPCVSVQITYKEGLVGTNVLVLHEDDVKVIADLMMGGDGTNVEGELTDLHLSAISEAMNQMIGASATAMSTVFNKKIDIMPPVAKRIELNGSYDPEDVGEFYYGDFIQVDFHLKIGDLVDDTLSQLYPIEFAKEVCEKFWDETKKNQEKQIVAEETVVTPQQRQAPVQQPASQAATTASAGMSASQGAGAQPVQHQVEVQTAEFQNFDVNQVIQQKENIDLIMDVQLEVTVELGRTHRSIKDILEFSPGSIIELNKLAGEPIDVLVNGKVVAKGEVVVIDENFSVRITEIIKQRMPVV